LINNGIKQDFSAVSVVVIVSDRVHRNGVFRAIYGPENNFTKVITWGNDYCSQISKVQYSC